MPMKNLDNTLNLGCFGFGEAEGFDGCCFSAVSLTPFCILSCPRTRYYPAKTDLLNAVNGRVSLDAVTPRVCVRGPEDRQQDDFGYPWLPEDEYANICTSVHHQLPRVCS